MKSIDIFHGNDKEIKSPKISACNTDNDFGSGFYTTESVESARDWALVNTISGEAFCNHYTIDLDDLAIVDLNEYGILAWIAEVVSNRGADSKINYEIGEMLAGKSKDYY